MVKVNLTHSVNFRDTVMVIVRFRVSIGVNYRIGNMLRARFIIRGIVLWL